MLNKVTLIGSLGTDVETKVINDNATVANFSLATNKRWVDKSGQKQEKTEWHRIVTWNKTAELCSKYLTKGSKVYLEGEIETQEYEKDGEKRYATKIIARDVKFLSPKGNTAPAVDNNDTGEIPF